MSLSHKQKPIIGISTNLLKIVDGPFQGQDRIYVNQGYVDSVIEAGGIPLMLPMVADADTTTRLISLIDGVVLSGGQDVHPSHYNEECHPLLGTTAVERDAYELLIIRTMHAANKPILGICRGMQLLNVAFGGTLYQDLSLHDPKCKPRHSKECVDSVFHTLSIIPKTKLHEVFGDLALSTNSYHHQSVKKLADGFTINAMSDDKVIEGIEKLDTNWILGVQWHPEVMITQHPEMRKLFEGLMEAAIIRRGLSL